MDSLPLFDPPPDTADDEAPTGAIVPRATVRDMVARRQKALDLFAKYHTTLSGAGDAGDKALAAFQAIDHRGREDRYTHNGKAEEAHFLNGLKPPTKEDFTKRARVMVDRRMWAVLVELTDLERFMDRQAKDELFKQLQEEPPEATEANIFATLDQFMLDADTIFKRGIANCFSKLDRRFRSHDGWKIGARVVLTRMFDENGWWNYHRHDERATLHDIDRVFQVLDGNETPHMLTGIVGQLERARGTGYGARQRSTESTYFRVHTFKNGNAHIWFKRDDLLEKVNKLLGEYYGAPIPEDRDATDDPLATPKTALAKNYGFYPTPDKAADTLIDHAPLWRRDGERPPLVLEPSAGTGNLVRKILEKGARVDCIEVHPERAEQLYPLARSVKCADFLTVEPTPIYDVVVMNPPFDRERDIDHVTHAMRFLNPEGCLVAIMSAGTEFRETRKSIAFRELMASLNADYRDLPAGSFASVGTYCNTVILKVWKDGRNARW